MLAVSAVAIRYRRLGMLSVTAAAAVPFLFNLSASIGEVINHFGLTYAVAFAIVSLIVEGSWWVAIWFPYIIPAEVTVQILVAIFGIGYAVGW